MCVAADFNLEFYTEVQDLSYLVHRLNMDPSMARFRCVCVCGGVKMDPSMARFRWWGGAVKMDPSTARFRSGGGGGGVKIDPSMARFRWAGGGG